MGRYCLLLVGYFKLLFTVLSCMFLRKKSIVVVGTYEVAYVPEINYGALLSLRRRLEVKFILRHTSKILAVSKSSEKEILRFTMPKNLKLVYNGIDAEKFKPAGEKENLVVTVGAYNFLAEHRTIIPFILELFRTIPLKPLWRIIPYIAVVFAFPLERPRKLKIDSASQVLGN